MDTLNKREQSVLTYMLNHIKNFGYPPTVREICNSLDIKSTSTVHKTIKALEKKGFIKKNPSKPRAIEILDDISSITNTSDSVEEINVDATEIPVVGTVAAGCPILAEENIEDSLPIPNRYLSSGRHFVLKIKGDSMIEAGIFNGDYVLVRQQQTAENGEIVVAMVSNFEEEATVKTFYKEKGRIRLQPQNSSMEPIITRNAEILGLVKGVFRYFK